MAGHTDYGSRENCGFGSAATFPFQFEEGLALVTVQVFVWGIPSMGLG